MGTTTSVLECQTRYPLLPTPNCTIGSVEFGSFPSNPSITGIGTDLSFTITALLSLITSSLIQIVCDRLRQHQYLILFAPLVISFSDQQIVRGLALSIAALYTSASCTIDAYRFDILCYLSIMSITSHITSVLVLRSYTNGQKLVAVFRFSLVFVQVFFAGILFSSRITGDFPTGVPTGDIDLLNTTLVLPAVCFQLPDTKPYDGLEDIPRSHTKDFNSFIPYIVMAIFYVVSLSFTAIHIITHYLSPGSSWQARQTEKLAPKFSWFWWLGAVRGLILGGAWVIWGWSAWKMYKLRQWLNDSGWLGDRGLMDDSEWNFGQLLTMLLMGAAILSFANAWSGYKQNQEDTKEEKAATEASQSARGSRIFEGGDSALRPRSQYFRANGSESPTDYRNSRVVSGVYGNWDPPRYENDVEMSPLVGRR